MATFLAVTSGAAASQPSRAELAGGPAGALGAASVVRPKAAGPLSSVDVHPFKGGVYLAPEGVALSPDRLLVRFRANASPVSRATARSSVSASPVRSFRLVPRLELVKLPPGQSAAEAAAKLTRDPAVQYAVPDVLVPLQRVPNDALYAQLWGMTNIGAPAAWERSTGSSSIRVGVLDTGVATTHPDLAANVWTNAGEVAGNGLDDDGNGYVDDVNGWDFNDGDNDPSDVSGHGTHVAGTIGAVGDNGIGVAGVNWTVKLVPLKICSASSCSLAAQIEALQYAVDQGVKVVNASFGSARATFQPEQDAIAAAGAAGVLYVAAAGNNSSNNDSAPHYPAGYSLGNVISVGALAPGDSLAPFSNFGLGSVHLAAPGQDILSTVPSGTGYEQMSGSSMAAPHVAGAAALLWSVNPGWTMQQIRARLLTSARGSSSLSGKVMTCGILDADSATDPVVGNDARLCIHPIGTGAGIVSSLPAGIDCGSSCTATFAPGTSVTLTPTPAPGSTFAGWSGACAGTGACSVTVTTGAAVTATFRTSGTPPYWSETLLTPPAARAPTLPATLGTESFFNVSLSADGATRAKTIFNARENAGGVVSCYYDTTDTGGVYLERKTPAGWVADGTLTAPEVGTDGARRWANCHGFGSVTELAGDGSTLLVSQSMAAVLAGEYRCAAFVYRRGASAWVLDGTLFPPGINETGSPTWEGCRYFGTGGDVSDDGSRSAILSFGRADVYVRTGGGWTLEQHLELPAYGDTIARRYIALSGDGTTLLVGDPGTDDGEVYAYSRTGSQWTLTQTIPAPEPCGGFCNFGDTVALSQDGSTAAIAVQRVTGLPWVAGAVWAYERDATGWHPRRKLTATVPEELGQFTCPTVARNGARLVCGASDTVGRNERQGSLYVVDREGSSWAAGSFVTRAFAGDGFAGDHLGRAGANGSTFAASADGASIDTTIRAENIVQGIYGQDRIGYSFTVPTPTFADVPTSNPFYGYIEQLYDLGITTGCGTNGVGALIYCPTDPVPRQQMAAFLIRAKGLPQLIPATPSFVDVPASNQFFGYIERLKEQGITTGCNPPANDRFCPSEFVPRQQMAAFLIRAKGLTQLFPATPSFVDVPASNPFFGYIERLKEQGITTGCNPPTNDMYCPLENVPRQQMAAFLVRAFG